MPFIVRCARTATQVAPGTASLSGSSSFRAEFLDLAASTRDVPTWPRQTGDIHRRRGSTGTTMTIGIVVVACRAAPSACVSGATMTSTLRSTETGGESSQARGPCGCPTVLNGDVLALNPAEVAQFLHEEGFLLPIRRRGGDQLRARRSWACSSSAGRRRQATPRRGRRRTSPMVRSRMRVLRHVWEDRQHAEA